MLSHGLSNVEVLWPEGARDRGCLQVADTKETRHRMERRMKRRKNECVNMLCLKQGQLRGTGRKCRELEIRTCYSTPYYSVSLTL